MTLGLALAAAIVALGLGMFGWFRSQQIRRSPRATGAICRLAERVAVVALVLVALASVIHLTVGHRPGTPSALDPVAFLGEHLALLITTGVALAALMVSRIARSVTREGKGG